MSSNAHTDLIVRAGHLLLPFVGTEADREELLAAAFYRHDTQIYYGIDRRGTPGECIDRCLRFLLDVGCPRPDRHPIATLLLTVRHEYGAAKQAEIDDLAAKANALCREARPSPPAEPLISEGAALPPIQTIETPEKERVAGVFISYHNSNRDFANKLMGELQSAGHACWIDTSIKGGEKWLDAIPVAINASYAFVVIVTLEALRSKWVRDEILWAREKEKLIIPVMLENVAKETEYFPLISYQGIKFFEGNRETAVKHLLNSLAGVKVARSSFESGKIAHSPELPVAPISLSARFKIPFRLEIDYLERLKLEELVNTEKYTPLAGTHQQSLRRPETRHEMRAVFELLQMGKKRQEMQRSEPFEDVIEKIQNIRRVVLLGDPGSGKTTTIWKLAAELVEQASNNRQAPIPLLIRLGGWTEANQPLTDFIASQLGDLGKHLDVLLIERRAALLLDGLNELPAGQRDEKYPQVQSFIEQNKDLLSVISCRELDYTIDLGFDRINILPLDPIRIREFVRHYLPTEQGETLFWKLAGPDARETYERFIEEMSDRLTDPERAFWLGTDPPADDVWGWSKEEDWNWKNWLELRDKPSSLMILARNPYMLLMLTSVYGEQGELPENRGELFGLFVEKLLKRESVPESEQKQLTDGLAKVAYEMQIRRADDEEGNALTVLPQDDVKAILGERLLYLSASASILGAGDQVRFTHQLLQEYFAALFMDLEIKAGRLKASDLWKPDRWWERNNWEEAAKLLAGLNSNDCTWVVEWIAEANPEVAAQCLKLSVAGIAEATRDRLRSQWIPRLTDLESDPDPKARAAIGRALGLTGWDNRKGVGTVPVQIANGRTMQLPDFDCVEIPGGEFQYGDESKYAAKSRRVTLPTFHISRYPVTVMQFKTFLDDPEGSDNPEWFEGLGADDDDSPVNEQWFKFDNHPRDSVNWYQAMAFCRWLSWRMGGEYELKKIDQWKVRLPTEFEWEKAARGTDGRIYPYQGDFDPLKANTGESEIGQTTAVGIYPNGASPYGVLDLSGNVWEWCLSRYSKPAIEARKENLLPITSRIKRWWIPDRLKDFLVDKLWMRQTRVLRGGSWDFDRGYARAVFRLFYGPVSRSGDAGFRVVVWCGPPFQNP